LPELTGYRSGSRLATHFFHISTVVVGDDDVEGCASLRG
jgi:hypothetical protein